MRTPIERFEENFTKGNGCWEWEANKDREGYGKFSFDGGWELAHRIAYQLYIGKIPDGLQVLHRCDNIDCVNPFHLFLGTDLERFEEKFVKRGKGDCWEWMASKNWKGYGNFWSDGKHQRAHRAAYELYIGEIPDGLHVLHRCDNPSCVNPAHLFLGTNTDNVHDCIGKGRLADHNGENNGCSKLTSENIRIIREMYTNGVRQVDLAKRFGVTQANISLIVRGDHWTKL